MIKEPEFWVAVAFVLFIGVLVYVGAHKKVTDALDHRSARIKAELDEARRLRDEAGKLLAEYQRKQREAEREADADRDQHVVGGRHRRITLGGKRRDARRHHCRHRHYAERDLLHGSLLRRNEKSSVVMRRGERDGDARQKREDVGLHHADQKAK